MKLALFKWTEMSLCYLRLQIPLAIKVRVNACFQCTSLYMCQSHNRISLYLLCAETCFEQNTLWNNLCQTCISKAFKMMYASVELHHSVPFSGLWDINNSTCLKIWQHTFMKFGFKSWTDKPPLSSQTARKYQLMNLFISYSFPTPSLPYYPLFLLSLSIWFTLISHHPTLSFLFMSHSSPKI